MHINGKIHLDILKNANLIHDIVLSIILSGNYQ